MKLLSGRQTELSDFEEVDPQVYASMKAIASATEAELHAMQLTFESPNGEPFEAEHGEKQIAPGNSLSNTQSTACLYCHAVLYACVVLKSFACPQPDYHIARHNWPTGMDLCCIDEGSIHMDAVVSKTGPDAKACSQHT